MDLGLCSATWGFKGYNLLGSILGSPLETTTSPQPPAPALPDAFRDCLEPGDQVFPVSRQLCELGLIG